MARSLFLTKLLIRTGITRLLPRLAQLPEGGEKFLHYYSDRVLDAPRKSLQQAATFIEPASPSTIDLSVGTPRLDQFSTIADAPTSENAWPAPGGLPELRRAVVEMRGENALPFNFAHEVLITQGATGAFHTVLDTFVNRGQRVVAFEPTSPLFPLTLQSRRIKVRWIPTTTENGRLSFRLEALAQSLRGSRLLILPPVGNPTGGLITREDVDQILWWARKRDVLIYGDEAFSHYLYEGEQFDWASCAEVRSRLLLAGTLSKSHGLSSLRVGWLCGNRHLIQACQVSEAVRTPFVPTVCQRAALQALRTSTKEMNQICEGFGQRRQYVFDRLQSMGLKPVWPASGLFFWVSIEDHASSGRAFAERLLKEQGVQVTPGELCGPSGESFVRISFALDEGRLREGLRRLEASFAVRNG